MKIAIVGSRSLEGRRSDVRHAIQRSPWLAPDRDYDGVTIVSGGADGVDTYAEQFAEEHDIPVEILEPNWQKYGPAAGPKRNSEIINRADVAIVIWDGKSNGTADSLRKAIEDCRQLYLEKIE